MKGPMRLLFRPYPGFARVSAYPHNPIMGSVVVGFFVARKELVIMCVVQGSPNGANEFRCADESVCAKCGEMVDKLYRQPTTGHMFCMDCCFKF